MAADVIRNLVGEFALSVAAQTDAIGRGEATVGNEFAKHYTAAFHALRAHGWAGREALATLFDHERADVRAMAAAYLLKHCSERARAVLVSESTGTGLAALGAAQALSRWDQWTWTLDPE